MKIQFKQTEGLTVVDVEGLHELVPIISALRGNPVYHVAAPVESCCSTVNTETTEIGQIEIGGDFIAEPKPKRTRKPKAEPVIETPVSEPVSESTPLDDDIPGADEPAPAKTDYEAFKNVLVKANSKIGSKAVLNVVESVAGTRTPNKVPATKYETIMKQLEDELALVP